MKKNRESWEVRKKFVDYYTHSGDISMSMRSTSGDFEDDRGSRRDAAQEPEDPEEVAYRVATAGMNHVGCSLLAVDYGKIIFGREDLEPSVGEYNRTDSAASEVLFRFHSIESTRGRQSVRSNSLGLNTTLTGAMKSRASGTFSTPAQYVYRRSMSKAATPRRVSSMGGGDQLRTPSNVSTGNFRMQGSIIGNDFTSQECGYNDIPKMMMFVSSALSDPSLDPTCVASLLGRSMPENILVEIESEILQIRDELYHRIICYILQKGFYNQQQLSSIAKAGAGVAAVATTPSIASLNNKSGSMKRLNSTSLKDGADGDPLVAALKRSDVVNIDDAIYVSRHLGVKSDNCRRLYVTALLIRDLRHSLAVRPFDSI